MRRARTSLSRHSSRASNRFSKAMVVTLVLNRNSRSCTTSTNKIINPWMTPTSLELKKAVMAKSTLMKRTKAKKFRSTRMEIHFQPPRKCVLSSMRSPLSNSNKRACKQSTWQAFSRGLHANPAVYIKNCQWKTIQSSAAFASKSFTTECRSRCSAAATSSTLRASTIG